MTQHPKIEFWTTSSNRKMMLPFCNTIAFWNFDVYNTSGQALPTHLHAKVRAQHYSFMHSHKLQIHGNKNAYELVL